MVDDVGQGATSSYTFTNVTDDHTISVTFRYTGSGGDGRSQPTYLFRTLTDGGRRMLTQVAVDLLIVDVRLGAYNGLQLVVFSQSLPPSPPAIVTSGFEDRVLEEEARRLGRLPLSLRQCRGRFASATHETRYERTR
jgi:hypothetical protein